MCGQTAHAQTLCRHRGLSLSLSLSLSRALSLSLSLSLSFSLSLSLSLRYGAETGKTAKKTLSTLWDTTVEAVLKAIEKDEPDVINYAIEFSLARRLLLTVVEVAALSVKDQNDPMLKYAIEQRLGGDEFAPFVDRETLLAQPQCGGCSRIGGTKFTCSRCKVTKYCGANCQRGHWKVHKPFCVAAPKPDAAE